MASLNFVRIRTAFSQPELPGVMIDVLLTLILRLSPVMSRRGDMRCCACAILRELLFCTTETTEQALQLTLHPQRMLLL
jgi:hypothetical protein